MDKEEAGLPVRSKGDVDEKVLVKVVDFTTPANGMTVDTDGNAHAEMHGNDPGGTDRVLRTSEQGSASVDGVYDVTNNTDPSQVGVVAMEPNASPADTQQTRRVTASQSADASRRGLHAALLDEDSEPYTETNPLPVFPVSDSEGGTEIHDEDEADTVASDGGTANHDFVVNTGETFLLDQILASGSTRFKIELQIGDGAATEVFTSQMQRFASESRLEADIVYTRPITVVGTVDGTTVRVIKTNLDKNDTQDIITNIVGLLRT